MVTTINCAPKDYKAPSFEKVRITLLDECKRDLEKDLSPVKDTVQSRGFYCIRWLDQHKTQPADH